MVQRYNARYVDYDAAIVDNVRRATLPIYSYGCKDFCGTDEPIKARLIDVTAPFVLGARGDTLPVYMIPPRECCEGRIDELFEESCWPPGVPRDLVARVVVVNHAQHCQSPGCRSFIMTYSGGHWQGEVELPGGTLHLDLECQPLADPLERWKLTVTGCHSEVFFATALCTLPLQLIAAHSFFSEDCCDCPGSAPQIDIEIRGACGYNKLAKLIDVVAPFIDGQRRPIPVYSYTECCSDGGPGAPTCCERLKCTLVATLATDDPDCSCMDGLVVSLFRDDITTNWLGTTSACDGTVAVQLTCRAQPALGCDTDNNLCDPQGYPLCQYRDYSSGAFIIGIKCGSLQATGGVCPVFCDLCDCGGEGEPLDFTVTVPVQFENDGCPCGTILHGFTNVSVRITE